MKEGKLHSLERQTVRYIVNDTPVPQSALKLASYRGFKQMAIYQNFESSIFWENECSRQM